MKILLIPILSIISTSCVMTPTNSTDAENLDLITKGSKSTSYAINPLEFYPDEDYVQNIPMEIVINGCDEERNLPKQLGDKFCPLEN